MKVTAIWRLLLLLTYENQPLNIMAYTKRKKIINNKKEQKQGTTCKATACEMLYLINSKISHHGTLTSYIRKQLIKSMQTEKKNFHIINTEPVRRYTDIYVRA